TSGAGRATAIFGGTAATRGGGGGSLIGGASIATLREGARGGGAGAAGAGTGAGAGTRATGASAGATGADTTGAGATRAGAGGGACAERGARAQRVRRAAMTRPHQIDRSEPVGSRRPRDSEFRGPIAKMVGGFRQPRRVDAEQRIQRLDLEIETFHQRHRHAA